MTRNLRALAAAGLVFMGTACNSFLTGDKLSNDPNRPTSAQAAQLFVSSQVSAYYILSGHAARVLAMWSQQMAGTDRQYIGYDQYSVTEGLFQEFTSTYVGGGVIDHKAIQADAAKSGNKTLVGISKVWEALIVSFAADNYGDVPYSEAGQPDKLTPKLDPQASVYAALQTLLDGAIADLSANQGSVGTLDLSLASNNAAWIRVARTLKARLYMHTGYRPGIGGVEYPVLGSVVSEVDVERFRKAACAGGEVRIRELRRGAFRAHQLQHGTRLKSFSHARRVHPEEGARRVAPKGGEARYDAPSRRESGDELVIGRRCHGGEGAREPCGTLVAHRERPVHRVRPMAIGVSPTCRPAPSRSPLEWRRGRSRRDTLPRASGHR